MQYVNRLPLVIASAALVLASFTAAAQQIIPHPTAEQVTVQILESEARNYRDTIGKLAVQVNDLTAQIAALKAKCGKACEEAEANRPIPPKAP